MFNLLIVIIHLYNGFSTPISPPHMSMVLQISWIYMKKINFFFGGLDLIILLEIGISYFNLRGTVGIHFLIFSIDWLIEIYWKL